MQKRVAEVWNIGEQKFKNNYLIRTQMFKSLIIPAVTYGAEITGWSEWESIELTQRRYLRWVLGLSRGTKKAILMEETKAIPIYIETGKKAMMYEERINNSPCEVLRECLREVRSGLRTWWTEKRRTYCNRNGWSDLEINAAGNRGESTWEILLKRDIECWQQQQFNLLKLSRYRLIRADRVPWYLQRGRNISIIARFRCENEEWGMNSWRKERKCRICGTEEETVNHMRAKCCPDMRTLEQLMDERGSGENWMRSVLAKREKMLNKVPICI